jgi:hypothetical protein
MLRNPIAKTLHSTPILKKVLIKYNTSLPSSAPVEWIFSVGGAILSKKKRGKMNDEHFEKTMSLKCNKNCWEWFVLNALYILFNNYFITLY